MRCLTSLCGVMEPSALVFFCPSRLGRAPGALSHHPQSLGILLVAHLLRRVDDEFTDAPGGGARLPRLQAT